MTFINIYIYNLLGPKVNFQTLKKQCHKTIHNLHMWPNWEEILIDGKMNKQIISFSPHKNLKLQKNQENKISNLIFVFNYGGTLRFGVKRQCLLFLATKMKETL